MKAIRNLKMQERQSNIQLPQSAELALKAGLYVMGPGVYTWNLDRQGPHLFIVFGNRENLASLPLMKTVVSLLPVNRNLCVHTDYEGNYFLFHDNNKPGIVVHAYDICFSPKGGMMSNLELDSGELEYPDYTDWKPIVLDTVMVPMYTYFLDRATNLVELETYHHLLKEVKGLSFDYVEESRVELNLPSNKEEAWDQIMGHL